MILACQLSFSFKCSIRLALVYDCVSLESRILLKIFRSFNTNESNGSGSNYITRFN